MSPRRRTKQDDAEGIGCAVLVLIVGVIYLFNTYPWLWYVLYTLLALLVLGLIAKVAKKIMGALERSRAEAKRKRQLEEAQRQQRVRAEIAAWKKQKRLKEQRTRLVRVLASVAEVKPARDEERRRRKEAKRREEEARRRKVEEEEKRQEVERRERRAEEEREKRTRFKKLVEENKVMSRVEQMSGIEFERFMASFFLARGYSKVEMTPRSGDQGVDLLLITEKRKVAVQLKRQVNPVGNYAVHAVLFGMHYYDADEAWVVTTSSFTQKAKEAAYKTGVRLYGGSELRRWLREPFDE